MSGQRIRTLATDIITLAREIETEAYGLHINPAEVAPAIKELADVDDEFAAVRERYLGKPRLFGGPYCSVEHEAELTALQRRHDAAVRALTTYGKKAKGVARTSADLAAMLAANESK